MPVWTCLVAYGHARDDLYTMHSSGGKKGRAPKAHKLPERFPSGEVLQQAQPSKKKWQLGDVIGQGGFGLIYKGKICYYCKHTEVQS